MHSTPHEPSGSTTRAASSTRIVGAIFLALAFVLGNAGVSHAAGTVTAVVQQDSAWSTGWCGVVAVRNSTASPVKAVTTSFVLPPGSTLRSWWNATPAVAGSNVTMSLPAWAHVAADGTYRDSGFCLTGSAQPPTAPTVQWQPAGSAPSPTATPTPTPTATPTPSPTATPTTDTDTDTRRLEWHCHAPAHERQQNH